MTGKASLLAVLSLICLQFVGGRTRDDFSPRHPAERQPRALHEVLRQADGRGHSVNRRSLGGAVMDGGEKLVVTAKNTAKSVLASGTSVQVTYYKMPLDGVVVREAELAAFPASSLKKCAALCPLTEGCAMFTFHPRHYGPRENCHLYAELPRFSLQQEAWLGARSYALSGFRYPTPKRCTNGYSSMCGLCLKYIPGIMGFSSARHRCRKDPDGEMVVVKSPPGVLCVQQFVINQRGRSDTWLGAMCINTGCVWNRATGGGDLSVGSPMWEQGEPNLPNSAVIVAAQSYEGRLRDVPVDSKNHVVCQQQ